VPDGRALGCAGYCPSTRSLPRRLEALCEDLVRDGFVASMEASAANSCSSNTQLPLLRLSCLEHRLRHGPRTGRRRCSRKVRGAQKGRGIVSRRKFATGASRRSSRCPHAEPSRKITGRRGRDLLPRDNPTDPLVRPVRRAHESSQINTLDDRRRPRASRAPFDPRPRTACRHRPRARRKPGLRTRPQPRRRRSSCAGRP
jgi:hypothetical protein